MRLALKSILWAIVFPGTVTLALPWMMISEDKIYWPLHWWGLLGLLCFLLGAIALIWCIFAFARIGKGTLSPVSPTKHLVIHGLYRYVRNPMYVSVLLVLSGELIAFPSWTMLLYFCIVFIAFHTFVVFFEEPRLRREFPKEYEEYCRKVRRWIPGRPFSSEHTTH